MTKANKTIKLRRPKMDSHLTKIVKLAEAKPPLTKKEERRLTASISTKVKTYDMSASVSTKKSVKQGTIPLSQLPIGERARRAIAKHKIRQHTKVLKNEAAIAARREARPLPDKLPTLMAPILPPREPGSKPNIISLLYAFRAFQQFSYAFTRRSMGLVADSYYLGLKDRFKESLQELGLADMFDWEDF